MTRHKHSKLVPLKDSELTLQDSGDDICWRTVVDSAGDEVGKVDELLVDEANRAIRFLRIQSGGFLGLGTTKTLVPAEAIEAVIDGVVHLNQRSDRVAGAPRYDPLLVDENYYDSVYDYYGY